MKLAAVCCTYHRPEQLGHLIECFRRQDYPLELRELIILDDVGQYKNAEGDGWRIISVPRRFNTLGEKRNACAGMVSSDVQGLLVADDDDIYMPHWFKSQARALELGQWSRPSKVLLGHGSVLKEADTGGLFHSGWAYHRSLFNRMLGYRHMNNGEDQDLADRMMQANVIQADPCQFAPPFLYYRENSGSYHISYMGENAYNDLGNRASPDVADLRIELPVDFSKIHVIRQFGYGPDAVRKGERRNVELIRPCEGYSQNGPQNGMTALQKVLRRKIDEGIDWLSIRNLPVSRGAMPWFWHWEERGYAGWWNSQGHPFVQGPNMLFTFSGSPRIDGEECELLDAENCRIMFCHSEWYRRLINQNRRHPNRSQIVTWPYPIDPWPSGPLDDQFDLLIYCKSGHRPNLDETLQAKFPRHARLVYGHHTRNDLFEIARRSRACAYLSDDDSGGLVVQELLLAGCPTVGVGTGSPFVLDGVTGFIVDRLPVGEASATSFSEQLSLQIYLTAIEKAQTLDRNFVRECAAVQFSPEAIADRILDVLNLARQY